MASSCASCLLQYIVAHAIKTVEGNRAPLRATATRNRLDRENSLARPDRQIRFTPVVALRYGVATPNFSGVTVGQSPNVWIRIPIVLGRGLSWRDSEGSRKVAVINSKIQWVK